MQKKTLNSTNSSLISKILSQEKNYDKYRSELSSEIENAFEKWVKKYVRNSLRTYWIPGPGKEPEKRIKYNMSKNIQERLERHFAKVKYNKQNKQYKYARNFTKA